MNSIEIRAEMARRGWQSEDRLTKDGWKDGPGYSIWFKRWDWHGIRCDRIVIHGHERDLKAVDRVIAATAARAQLAWDTFTDSVPHQAADYSLREDSILTEHFRKLRAMTNGKICVACHIELRPYKTGVAIAEMSADGPMALFSADMWHCPNCEWQGILGVGHRPTDIGTPSEIEAKIVELQSQGKDLIRFWLNQREKDAWLAKGHIEL